MRVFEKLHEQQRRGERERKKVRVKDKEGERENSYALIPERCPNRDGANGATPCGNVPLRVGRGEIRRKGERKRDGRKAKTINKIAGSEGARARIRRVASLLFFARDHEIPV